MSAQSDAIAWANSGQYAAPPSPGYNPIFKTDFGGKLPTQTVQGAPSYNLNDPVSRGMYGMTLGAGGAGADLTGTQAFLGAWNPSNDTKQDQFGKYTYDTSTLGGLAGQLGIDTSKYNLGTDVNDADYYKLSNDLNEQLKNYHYISGMSSGWNPQGNARSADRTLYLDDGTGNLNPVTAPVDYTAREKGNWFQENEDGVMAALILGGGFLGGTALAGMGAGAGTGAATTAAAGAGGTGTGGLAGSLQAFYAGLPGWGQGALTGAAQGGVSSAISGQNPLKGAAIGALTGGLGAWGGGALAGATGMPAWAAKGLVSAGTGGLGAGLSGGDWKRGALAGGLGSLAGSALSSGGLDSTLAGRLGGMAGNYGAGAILGGAGGGSGGGSSQPGQIGAPSSGGGAATGMSGGLAGPQLGAAQAQEQAWLRQAYAPVAAEAAKKKLAKRVLDELDDQTA